MELWRGDPRLAQCILDNGALLLFYTGGIPYLIKQLKAIVFTNFWKLPNWTKKGQKTGWNGQNMVGQLEISKFAFRIPRHLPPVATKNINDWHGSFMISRIWCEMGMKSCLFHPYCYCWEKYLRKELSFPLFYKYFIESVSVSLCLIWRAISV